MWLTTLINSNYHFNDNSKFFKKVLILRIKVWLKRFAQLFIWKLSTIINLTRIFCSLQKIVEILIEVAFSAE